MPQRLVFGDDGSEHADVAWLWISSQVWPGWQIDIVTAVPEKGDQSQPLVSRTLGAGAMAGGVSHREIEGDPRRVLVTAAEDSDLLVVGPRGRGLLKALHLGSTAESLIQVPPVPLLLARDARPANRAVVAADGSGHAQPAEAALISLPWARHLDVLVLTIGDEREGAAVTSAAADRIRDAVGSVETRVQRPDDLPVFYRARDFLLETVADWTADVVVLGSHGLTDWESVNEFGVTRSDSTASAVAAHAPCSVLLARPG